MGSEELPPAKAALRRRKLSPALRAVLVVTAILASIGILYRNWPSQAPPPQPQPPEPAQVVSAPPPARAKVVALAEPAIASSPPPVAAEPPAKDVISLKVTVNGEMQSVNLRLLPQYSEPSVAFMRHAADTNCGGELYRSEKDFLVQGRISCKSGAPKVVKGDCPAGVKVDKSRNCPSHDPNCGCHGPFMGKGMVGWAGGSAGPDLFIYTAAMDKARCPIGKCEATHWSHDHTVWAEVAGSVQEGADRCKQRLFTQPRL